jgi:hypothetical protein
MTMRVGARKKPQVGVSGDCHESSPLVTVNPDGGVLAHTLVLIETGRLPREVTKAALALPRVCGIEVR